MCFLVVGLLSPLVSSPADAIDNQVSRWRYTAFSVGWKSSQWRKLSCLIKRESEGDPKAYNGNDPHGGSRGLLQINGVHNTWLKNKGVIRYNSDLYIPWRNLRAAYLLYKAQGWKAWTSSRRC